MPDPLPHATPQLEILYVEDNPTNAVLLSRIFARVPSAHLTISQTGQAGLVAFRQVRPDLIFLDLHLPDIDGEEVLREIRAQEESIRTPVIVLTADASRETRERVIAAGADRLITKPLQVEEILAAAREVSARAAVG